jgi:hypothetical protein
LLYEDRDNILGMNYWVLRGGSTSLVNSGAETRQGYNALRSYFLPANIHGIVLDTLGQPVPNAKIRIEELDAETTTNQVGLYNLAIPGGKDVLVKLTADDYSGEKEKEVKLVPGGNSAQDFTLERSGMWYRIKVWFKNLFK